MQRLSLSRIHLMIAILIALVAVAACTSSGNSASTATEAPTLTPFPSYSFVQPTQPPQLATGIAATATAVSSTSSLDPDKVAKGKDRYTALTCNTCHGDNGEGTDKGKALTSFAMSEDDFVSFMRSGGSMGSAHQYSTNRLSDSGGKNLYEYLKSLSGQ
jgi:mono/diheme cytochrome c family protein